MGHPADGGVSGEVLPLGPPCSGDGVAHVILAVTDDGSPKVTSYRRVILRVHAAGTY
jgi:hypothetical protein